MIVLSPKSNRLCQDLNDHGHLHWPRAPAALSSATGLNFQARDVKMSCVRSAVDACCKTITAIFRSWMPRSLRYACHSCTA